MLAPLVRRTWSPRGRTPVLSQVGRHRQKISAIAALCVAPDRRRLRLYFRLLPNANVNAAALIRFLRNLRRHLRAPVVLVWDRLNSHVGRQMRAFVATLPNLWPRLFPPYAPELDPVEYVWSYLKSHPLANHASPDLAALAVTTRRHGRSIQRRQPLLRSFLHHCPLPLRLR